MLVKDTAAGVIQQLESFTAKYFTDNQGYASPPTSTEFPRPRTLTASDIPDIVSAVNGYGASASASVFVLTRTMSMATQGTATVIAATATTPLGYTPATSVSAGSSAGITESFVGSRTLGILKSVKYSIRLQQTANCRIWVGVGSTASNSVYRSDTPNSQFVGFRFSSAAGDTTFQCVTQTSNVASTKNAASPAPTVGTTQHTLEIQFDGTNAVFFVDGVQVGSQAGNIPSTSQGLAHLLLIDNVGLGNIVKFDFYSLVGADYPTG